MKKALIFTALCILSLAGCSREGTPEDRQEIQSLIDAYTEAFNDQNVDQLVGFWTDDGVYVDAETGEETEGKEELKEAYEEYFQNHPSGTLSVEVKSLRFQGSNHATEKGVASLRTPNIGSLRSSYTAHYVKTNGKWLIAKVSDNEEFLSTSHFDELEGLEWLVGEWADSDEDFEVVTTTRWDQHKNFLIQTFTVKKDGNLELEGQHIIGWDPSEKKIRSWVFDSDGGFAEGVWNQINGGWTVEFGSTLPDGGYGSSVNQFLNITDNSYDWSSLNREIDGEMLPNVGPVTIKRRK